MMMNRNKATGLNMEHKHGYKTAQIKHNESLCMKDTVILERECVFVCVAESCIIRFQTDKRIN